MASEPNNKKNKNWCNLTQKAENKHRRERSWNCERVQFFFIKWNSHFSDHSARFAVSMFRLCFFCSICNLRTQRDNFPLRCKTPLITRLTAIVRHRRAIFAILFYILFLFHFICGRNEIKIDAIQNNWPLETKRGNSWPVRTNEQLNSIWCDESMLYRIKCNNNSAWRLDAIAASLIIHAFRNN